MQMESTNTDYKSYGNKEYNVVEDWIKLAEKLDPSLIQQ